MAVFSVSKTNAAPVTKTINRDLYVKIHTSNNAAGANGPWSLGVPGIARLKKVYLGNNTAVNTSSTDITKYFYINVGDDENAYRSARLVLANKTALTLTANQFMLVQFDAFTVGGQEGFFTVGSYSINDTANLASSTSTINTLEIPETVTKTGAYYDLRDTIDFRPYSTNTAVLSTTVAGASINPANTFALSGDDQFFPTPDSTATFDVTYFLQRTDAVTVDVNSDFSYNVGVPSLTPKPPRSLGNSLLLGLVLVPPYPSLPYAFNATTSQFASKQIGNDRGIIAKRVDRFKLTTSYGRLGNLQPRRYSMRDIGRIERRLENVEYQLSLDNIEKSITRLSLPSGVTPTLNRFKNAFFVEGFNDFSRAASLHREFACSIDTQQTTMKPLTKVLNFECQFDRTDGTTAANIINGRTLTLPYTQEVFVDQSIKSDIVGVDGHAIQFVGTIDVNPSSFSLLAEVEVIPDAPIVITYVVGAPPVIRDTGGGGGGGGGDRNRDNDRDRDRDISRDTFGISARDNQSGENDNGGSWGDNSAGCSCYLAGSEIAMADGRFINIEDVKVGDHVLGAFGEINEIMALMHVKLGDRKMYKVNQEHDTTYEEIHISPDKKMYSIDTQVTYSEYNVSWNCIMGDGSNEMLLNVGVSKDRLNTLSEGVELQTITGPRIVNSLKAYDLPSDTTLYNFVLNGSHTFFVNDYAVASWPREDTFDYDEWAPKNVPNTIENYRLKR
jgi:hypothetical protein